MLSEKNSALKINSRVAKLKLALNKNLRNHCFSLYEDGLKACRGVLVSILLFCFVLFSPCYKFTSLEAYYHDENLSKWLKKVKIQKKRDVSAVVLHPVVGLDNWCWWFWPVGSCSRYECPQGKRPGQLAFLLVSVLVVMFRERAQELSLTVLSCLQSSPVKQGLDSVQGLVGRDELLVLPRLCIQPWFEVGTFSWDRWHLSTADLALHHQELQFICV